jgi:hypothetical protein
VPWDTLILQSDYTPGATGFATIGHFEMRNPAPRGMIMLLGEASFYNVLVHELGHVLGMAHEHMRKDRDRYVKYRCDKMTGFRDKLAELQRKTAGATASHLCDNYANGGMVGFRGRDFTKGALKSIRWRNARW